MDRETLINIARTSLRTKLRQDLADSLTESIVDAILCIYHPGEPIDLHMVEIMKMQHKNDTDSRLIKGTYPSNPRSGYGPRCPSPGHAQESD